MFRLFHSRIAGHERPHIYTPQINTAKAKGNYMIKSIVLTLALGLAPQVWAKPMEPKAPEIKSFTPQNVSETTNQIRAVFDQDVVKLNAEEDANSAFNVS